jgi:primosomal protein N' (replication factor Y)
VSTCADGRSATPPGAGPGRVAQVALNMPLDTPLDYLVPDELAGRVAVGTRVRVPFRGSSSVLGYCVGLKDQADVPDDRLRPVSRCLDPAPLLSAQMLDLGRWIAAYYHCSLGEALHAMLPAAVRGPSARRRALFACPAVPLEEAERLAGEVFDRSPAQSKILRTLVAAGGPMSLGEALRSSGTSRSSAKALARKGWLTLEKRELVPDEPFALGPAEPDPHFQLTAEQRDACRTILGRLDRRQFGVVLLHGITSSGKTEVYLRCIPHVIDSGRQVIVLVPEISLTPQTIRHFAGRFGRLAVLHSRLTEAERRHQWTAIRRGEADVVIGARSAVFAPVPRLGLLIIDEEHENSFKQDTVPRYHARDVGIVRARNEGALVVLGSATPSLESHYNARIGKYTAIRLTRRIGGHPLPPVEVVDMRDERAGRAGFRVISHRLEARMRQSLQAGRQVLLFINRRGFSPFVHCPRCGYVLKCPRCDITLNFHRRINVVQCHYCGHQQRPPDACPECALPDLRFGGTGTERVESAVERLFPAASAVRMDSDTTRARRAHAEKLEQFRTGRSDVLIGTQMVAKGLDFPNVTTVGVVNADIALHLPDFRSRERTFQLLAQVAGRTGRGPAGGRVIVQTFMPLEPSIRAAADHDYDESAASGAIPPSAASSGLSAGEGTWRRSRPTPPSSDAPSGSCAPTSAATCRFSDPPRLPSPASGDATAGTCSSRPPTPPAFGSSCTRSGRC